MNNSPLVSIIVAVYNAEASICKCIDSLLAQTYDNIEVLLIDDGSKDRSGEICDVYAEKDNRVRTIHQPNGGVSVARQVGFVNAYGKYCIHVDPDDWVESNMIEWLVSRAESEDADAVYCDYYLNGTHVSVNPQSEDVLTCVVEIRHSYVCWNVLVKKAFAIENNISFTPTTLNHGEDYLFMCRLFSVPSIKTAYVEQPFYHYNSTNVGSLTNVYSNRTLQSMLTVVRELEKMFGKEAFDGFYVKKKYTLCWLFCAKQYKQLQATYPEIHEDLIKELSSKKNSIFSFDSAMALALKGYPRIAHVLLAVCTKLHIR